jgi:hypothetical protein
MYLASGGIGSWLLQGRTHGTGTVGRGDRPSHWGGVEATTLETDIDLERSSWMWMWMWMWMQMHVSGKYMGPGREPEYMTKHGRSAAPPDTWAAEAETGCSIQQLRRRARTSKTADRHRHRPRTDHIYVGYSSQVQPKFDVVADAACRDSRGGVGDRRRMDGWARTYQSGTIWSRGRIRWSRRQTDIRGTPESPLSAHSKPPNISAWVGYSSVQQAQFPRLGSTLRLSRHPQWTEIRVARKLKQQ